MTDTIDIKKLVDEAIAHAVKNSTGALYDPARFTHNPFRLTQGVWGTASDTYYGSIQCCSKDAWDRFHWAVIEGQKVIFSWDIGERFTLDKHIRRYESPGETFDAQSFVGIKDVIPKKGGMATRFFIGQRLFYGSTGGKQARVGVGAIIRLNSYERYSREGNGPDWATTDTHQSFTIAELTNGRVRVGVRTHV